MAIAGIEKEIKWVKKKVRELRNEVSEIENIDLVCAFEELENSIDDLIDECEDTISTVLDL